MRGSGSIGDERTRVDWALADANLLFRMRMLAAEAYCRTESSSDVAALVSTTSFRSEELSVRDTSRDEPNRGGLVGESSVEVAGKYLARASNILIASGLIGLMAEVERTRRELGISKDSLESYGLKITDVNS